MMRKPTIAMHPSASKLALITFDIGACGFETYHRAATRNGMFVKKGWPSPASICVSNLFAFELEDKRLHESVLEVTRFRQEHTWPINVSV